MTKSTFITENLKLVFIILDNRLDFPTRTHKFNRLICAGKSV